MKSKSLMSQMLRAAITAGMGAGRVSLRGNRLEFTILDDLHRPTPSFGNQYPAFSPRECERRVRQAARNRAKVQARLASIAARAPGAL